MKKIKSFQMNELTNKHLKTIVGGNDDTVTTNSTSTETDADDDIDRGGGRPKTNNG